MAIDVAHLSLRTALSVESVVRGNGVVPATIGILDGRIHIGQYFVAWSILGSGSDR